jgi:hypothetical protein
MLPPVATSAIYSNPAPGIITSVPEGVDDITYNAILNSVGEDRFHHTLFINGFGKAKMQHQPSRNDED